MPKYKIGDLIDFIYGSGWGTRSQTGIIIEVRDRIPTSFYNDDDKGERFSYQCYGQMTQKYYWCYEREIKEPEEKWTTEKINRYHLESDID